MIPAYDKQYLDDAMRNLGEAVDFAASVIHMDMDEFMFLFIKSGIADAFEQGMPKFVCGMSGTELVLEVLRKNGRTQDNLKAQVEYDYSPEYWCGWILAYFQWKTGRPFRNIMECFTMKELFRLYPALHEASEDRAVDALNNYIASKHLPTRLQARRKRSGFTQKALSEESGIKLRTIQQYESGAKDINKAAGSTLQALAQVLSCKMEDLLEYGN